MDDDASDSKSDRKNGGLSVLGQFFRAELKKRGIEFDAVVVPADESDLGLVSLGGCARVIRHTSVSYGGNPDNTPVLSTDDAKTLQSYLGWWRLPSAGIARQRRQRAGGTSTPP